MQLGDIKDTLQGWLQDTVGVQWTDAKLNRMVNLALRETEKHILSHDPEAFKCTYTAATTVPSTGRDNLYAYPAGTFAVHEIALSADGVTYVPLQRLALKDIRDAAFGRHNVKYDAWDLRQSVIGNSTAYGWTVYGFVPYSTSHFILYPPQARAVSAGIRIIVAPTLVMSEDTDENPLPLGFETMLIKQAQIYALFDVGEPTDKLQAELDDMKKETPRFFLTSTEPAFIVPNVNRGF
jgi:hypothetical protein